MPSSGSSNTTTTQKFEPPEYTQAGWKGAIGEAENLFSQPFQQYQLPRVANLNELQQTGLNMAADWGMNGSPDLNAARQQNLQTSQGGFMGANPFTRPDYVNNVINDNAQNMTQAYQQGTQQTNNMMANLSGGLGGSGWQLSSQQGAQGLAKNVGQMANQARLDYANLGNQDYQAERGRMMQASGMAPEFANIDQQGFKAVTGAGDAYQANQQKLLDQAYQEFTQQRDYPQQQLSNMLSVLSQASGTTGGGGMTTSSGQTPGMSPLAGLLGAGALGGGLYSSGFFK